VFARCSNNILKISVFYGDIKFNAFTQHIAYDVPTLLGTLDKPAVCHKPLNLIKVKFTLPVTYSTNKL